MAFCLNNYLASYAKSIVYILNCLYTDLEKLDPAHQQIALGVSVPLGSKALLATALKLAIRRHTAKNWLSLPCAP